MSDDGVHQRNLHSGVQLHRVHYVNLRTLSEMTTSDGITQKNNITVNQTVVV